MFDDLSVPGARDARPAPSQSLRAIEGIVVPHGIWTERRAKNIIKRVCEGNARISTSN
jgi:hypothetical protein